METPEPRSPAPARTAAIAIVALGLIATSSVLAAVWSYGPGLNPDSMNYVAGARSILAGEGVLGTRGTPLVYWPPFLSVLLALFGLTGADLVRLGGILNALAFGGIVAASGFWLLRSCRHVALAVLGTVWVAASAPLFNVSCMLWSEPIFIFLTVLFLYQMHRYLESPGRRALVVAALIVACASLTRYIGVTLGAAGCLLILLASNGAVRKRLAACFLFGAVAAVPLAAWLVRNRVVGGTFTGPRSASDIGLLENVRRAGEGMALFFLRRDRADAVPGAVWFFAVALSALALVALAARSRRRREGASGPTPAAGPLAFCAVYAGAMVLAATTVAFTPLQGRYLSPLYVPGVLLVTFALDELIGTVQFAPMGVLRVPRGMSGWAILAALVATVGWGVTYGDWCAGQVVSAMRTGAGGYNSATWRSSETIGFLRQDRVPLPIYSNVPEAINKLTGSRARLIPRRKSTAGEAATFFAATSRSGGATVVWFDSHRRSNLYGPEALRRLVELKLVARLADGAVYRASAPRRAGAAQAAPLRAKDSQR